MSHNRTMTDTPPLHTTPSSGLDQHGPARFEWVLGGLVVVLLVAIRIHFAHHAGGLWRDEVHSVDVARDARFPMWQDSFPILWIACLRTWIGAVGSTSDVPMRMLGLICGLLLLAVSIWAPQGRRRHIPWVTLILFGMSPVVTTYGTEVRGYALGAATQLWMLGALQRWLSRPGLRTGILFTCASLVAVQAAFANSFLLLAGSMAAAIVCLSEKRWRGVLYLGFSGIVCATTVSPYALYVFPKWSNDWIVVVRQNFPIQWYFDRLIEAFGRGGWLALSAWGLLGAYGLRSVWSHQTTCQSGHDANSAADDEGGRSGHFEAWLLVIGSVLVFGYLKWLKVHTSDWYFMPLMALWAFCLDSILSNLWRSPSASLPRVAMASIVAISQFQLCWNAANLRMTNVDLAAHTVTEMTTNRDLVVVIPWIVGIPMQRYYHGSAPWMCLPEVQETDVPGIMIHGDGYRAVKNMMMREDALSAELAKVRETLQRGDRVFVVGSLEHRHMGKPLERLAPAPNSPYGWSDSAYQTYWTHLLELELQAHSSHIEKLPMKDSGPINPHEDCDVLMAVGQLKSSAK